MKPFSMFKIPVILLSFGGALILSPVCKAQEVSPDHFTSTGIEDLHQAAPQKVAAPKPMQTPPALQARNQRPDSATTLQLAATRDSSLAAEPSALAVPEKRKIAPRKPKKP